jgi:signal transduction histidine kinase
VRALSCSGDTIWAGTSAGLVQVQGNSQRLYTVKDGLADDGILSLRESRDGSLWIGTRSGFSRLRNGEFESFRPQDGLSQSSVFSIYEDREGSLWVGTKHGLNQFVEGRAIPYTVNEGLPSNEAGPLIQDSQGRVWVGTLDAGLAPFNGRRFSSIRARDGLSSDMVLSLAENRGGGVWVGTEKGLDLLKDGRVAATYGKQSGLPSAEIRSLFWDRAGVLWIGTAAGLARYKDGQFSIPRGMPRDPILAAAEDREGRPMFSTEHGLFRIEGSEIKEIAPNGNPLRGVDAIYKDHDGLLWLGSNGGGSGLRLLQENGGQTKITVFLVSGGLFDNEVYGIVADDQGRLWMACSKGIFSVARSELLQFAAGQIKKISSTPYSPTDALRVIECRPGVQPGVWKMNDGRLWFSTVRGLIVLDPARLQRNVPPPPVVIEDPIVNGTTEHPSEIGKLAPGKKNLEFNYTGLSFLAPTRINFSYILEGYDASWINAGTRREAYYTNLPPGKFRFRVTACNSDGLCNETGSALEFTLAPRFYQRSAFWPLVAAALALIGWLAYRLHIRRLRNRFDLIVAERSRIARELHDTLIQGFSGVTMAMQALAGRLRSPEERTRLDDIIHDAANCLRETRRSVAGLRAAREPEAGLGGSIAQAARQITETKDVRLKLKLDKIPAGLPPEAEYNLLRIATEALTNAVKHSGARNIEVTLKSLPDAVRLVIADDGAGFEPDDHGHLKPGHYGLIGMKERAAQIGAEFEFESAPGRGTTVAVVTPASRGAVLEPVK